MKEAQQIFLESEDIRSLYCVKCDECYFEAYRPISYKIASLIAQGHEIITGHVPDIYEKQNNSTNN